MQANYNIDQNYKKKNKLNLENGPKRYKFSRKACKFL